ncbi:MAG: SPOR domain-containing protein [Bacteroidota bacterium]
MKLKWLFAALVLANLGLWMWASWYRETPRSENRSARPPIAPEKMRLLSEPGVKLKPRKAPPPANSELAAAAAQVCFHIGPFPDANAAATGESKLNKWHLAVVRRPEEIRIVTGYRVYLPAFASKEAAERKRQQLTRLGFRDHAVTPEGPSQYSIALGLFAVEANAQARAHELAAKGVSAKVQPLTQSRTRYWLDINIAVLPDIAARMKQIDWGVKDVQAQEAACPAVAPPGPPPEHAPPDNAPH